LRELEITFHGSRIHICVFLKKDYPASHVKQGRVTHHKLRDSFFLKPTTEFAMKILKRCSEGCLDCYYILALLDPSARTRLHMLEFGVFRSLRALPAVLCSKMRYFFLMLHCVVVINDGYDTLLSNPGACTHWSKVRHRRHFYKLPLLARRNPRAPESSK
jgi:hypothetical protein